MLTTELNELWGICGLVQSSLLLVQRSYARAQKSVFCFQVKTAHSLSELGGTSITLHGKLDGVELISIGYKYNKLHVLQHFIMSENAGSTCNGDPYQMNFPHEYGNIHVREVPSPAVYFQ
jgi:hypothetical protein